MRNLLVAACLAAGFSLVISSQADASERVIKNATMISTKSNVSQSKRVADDGARFERKCVIMSCGTPWCFNSRVN